MIRFLNLKNQICEDSNDFAFYDTVTNTICSFGEQREQVFSSVENFKYNFGEEQKGDTRPLSRFLKLIPDDYFDDISKSYHYYVRSERQEEVELEVNDVYQEWVNENKNY